MLVKIICACVLMATSIKTAIDATTSSIWTWISASVDWVYQCISNAAESLHQSVIFTDTSLTGSLTGSFLGGGFPKRYKYYRVLIRPQELLCIPENSQVIAAYWYGIDHEHPSCDVSDHLGALMSPETTICCTSSFFQPFFPHVPFDKCAVLVVLVKTLVNVDTPRFSYRTYT